MCKYHLLAMFGPMNQAILHAFTSCTVYPRFTRGIAVFLVLFLARWKNREFAWSKVPPGKKLYTWSRVFQTVEFQTKTTTLDFVSNVVFFDKFRNLGKSWNLWLNFSEMFLEYRCMYLKVLFILEKLYFLYFLGFLMQQCQWPM
jgi:hypothetical protein